MRKFLVLFIALIFILSTAGMASALLITDLVDTDDDFDFGFSGVPGIEVDWTHTFSPPYPLPSSINSATLAIRAYDVDTSENDLTYGDGQYIGELDRGYNGSWHTTVFNLTSSIFPYLMDGTIYMQLNVETNWYTNIAWAELTVDYNPVPEPTTMLLLGTGLIGLAGARRKFRK